MTTILFLAANPRELSRNDLEQESNDIQDAILHRPFEQDIKIVPRWQTKAGELPQLLIDHKPDIVHFSSHGSETGAILLEDAAGNAQPVSASTLGKLFAIHKATVRCVVLNACYSQPQAAAIAETIPCVVGTTDAIADTMARHFSRAFYRALAEGNDLNTAFGQGALEIELQGDSQQAQVLVLLPSDQAGKGMTVVSGQRHAGAPSPTGDQQRYRLLLENFLEPLRMHLSNSKRTFDRLTADRRLDYLEMPIGKLQQFFAALENSDPRKSLWMIYIDQMITENGKSVALIEAHFGQVVRPDFKQACLDYLDHAITWEGTWKAMREGKVDVGPQLDSPAYIAPLFPSNFDAAFEAELAEVRRLAGV